MDLLHLEYFLTVAQMGSMTSAATFLNVAQSSVSRCIARLEDGLGVPLFERNGRGIVLTDYGRIFYSHAESIMREYADGERQLKELRDQYTGRISIATCAPRMINPLMIEYITEYPDILFRQRRITDFSVIKSNLDNGMLDYALTYSPCADPEYEWTPLLTENYYLLLSSSHPLSERTQISLAELSGESFLVNACDDPDFIEKHCKQAGLEPKFTFISDEYELLGPMAERGLGITLISTTALYDLKKSIPVQRFSLIRSIPIQDETFKRTLGVLCRKHHYMSAAAKNFRKKLIAYFKTIELEMNQQNI